MSYPTCAYSLLVKQNGDDDYTVFDCAEDEKYSMCKDVVDFLFALDGKTDPFKISPHISVEQKEEFLDFFIENKLVRKGRFFKYSLLNARMPLIKIRANMDQRAISWILNNLLMISFLPVFIAGLLILKADYGVVDFNDNPLLELIGIWVGIALGLVLHEFGHAIAGLGYNARVMEAGLLVGFSFGGYVLLDERRVKSRLKRVQILAAGIEMNLLLFGASMILTRHEPRAMSFLWGIAYINVLLALVNALFITGLDGSKIIDELLGTETLFGEALEFMMDSHVRSKMLSKGLIGYYKLFSCIVSILSQVAYPILIVLNVLLVGGVMFE